MTGQWSPRYADGLTPHPRPVPVEDDEPVAKTEEAPVPAGAAA